MTISPEIDPTKADLDATDVEVLRLAFIDLLELPEYAVTWLLDVWHVIQVLDDYADGDDVSIPDRNRAFQLCLGGMGANSFYVQNQAWLFPAMTQMFIKWAASDDAERNGDADERSYMWRAGFYDVVSLVVSLVHGPSSEKCFLALRLYGETATEYLKEFN